MRGVLGCTLTLVFCCGLSAEDKKEEAIDAKKLIGKWVPKEKQEDRKLRFEFRKDGTVVIDTDHKKEPVEGTYKLNGNKLSITIKVVGDMEQTLTPTVTKLTDTELVTTDEKGKEKTLVRVKDK